MFWLNRINLRGVPRVSTILVLPVQPACSLLQKRFGNFVEECNVIYSYPWYEVTFRDVSSKIDSFVRAVLSKGVPFLSYVRGEVTFSVSVESLIWETSVLGIKCTSPLDINMFRKVHSKSELALLLLDSDISKRTSASLILETQWYEKILKKY